MSFVLILTTPASAPTVPGAPTSVSATAGNAQATVTFTAPSNGGSAITGYTVTGSPSGSATGASSPITVTGLTNGTAYTFTVTATNAIGTGAAGGPSNSVTPSGSVINPSLPADFYVTLQGQNSPASATFYSQSTSGGNDSGSVGYYIPNVSNVGLGWTAATAGSFAIAGYNIRRSTDQATWTQIGTNLSGATVDGYGSSFIDTAATSCAGTSWNPVAGVYVPATTYYYEIETVDTQGNTSGWSPYPKMYVYYYGGGGTSVVSPSGPSGSAGGGFKWGGDLSGGYTTNYAAADSTYGETWQNTATEAFAYMLPTTGNIFCQYNQWVGACSYLYLEMSVSNASAQMGIHAEIVGDLPMVPPNGTQVGGNLGMQQYNQNGSLTANTYQLYKIPLTALMTPQTGWGGGFGSASAVGVLQGAAYKFLIQEASGLSTLVIKIGRGWYGP